MRSNLRVKKSTMRLADGRELIYFDSGDAVPDRTAFPDRRPPEPGPAPGQTRLDPVSGEWIAVAGARQTRPFLPGAAACPLCPSTARHLSEIPAPGYEVAVFENRFPALAGPPDPAEAEADPLPHRSRSGGGRCEVVCFTADHDSCFAALDPARAALVVEAWTDRTADLSALPGVEQVYVFENRGAEVGVTLNHPHGQVYALPYLTPRTARAHASWSAHLKATGRNLYDDVLAAELAAERVVTQNDEWAAFVPFAARWPYEAHLYPRRRVRDFTELDDAQRAALPSIYQDLLRRFDRLWAPEAGGAQAGGAQPPATPYIAAWHQAPVAPAGARPELALHLELFTLRRAPDKLKYLAGTESGMGAFMNDVTPEAAAQRLREAGR